MQLFNPYYMKNLGALMFFMGILGCGAAMAQSDADSVQRVAVTFRCEPCTKNNKLVVVGPEEHTFKADIFPLRKKLKPGYYTMTYWQKKVQQIHLPFLVKKEGENNIIVKE